LTKTGNGSLVLASYYNSSNNTFTTNTYSGGTVVSAGTLYLGGGSTVAISGSTVLSGPVGTGTLTLLSGSALAPYGSNVTIPNAVSLADNVTFPDESAAPNIGNGGNNNSGNNIDKLIFSGA